MTPEELAYSAEVLMEVALDVDVEPIVMKKGRLAFRLTVLSKLEDKVKIIKKIFKETSTIGIKEQIITRHSLRRELDHVELFDVLFKVKKTFMDGELLHEKLEYDCRKSLASNRGISILDVKM